MKLLIATNNRNKLKEIRAILGKKFDEILSLSEVDLKVDIEETGSTFFENALIKAREAADLSGIAALADDSGLSVDALCGAPGVYSARFAGPAQRDEDNNKLLLKVLDKENNRAARFISAIVLYFPAKLSDQAQKLCGRHLALDGTGGGSYIYAQGEAQGEILREMHGQNGFGYDPLFYSFDLEKTFAQASESEKNAVSHRAKALFALSQLLAK
jgi:non-canonical purine NTP pyrophosphatase (RdgB/HAM1 family)